MLENCKPGNTGGEQSGLVLGLITHVRPDMGELLSKHVNDMNVGFQTEVCKNCNFRPQLNFPFEPFLYQDVRNSK